jgi:PAS domain-containing protein
MHVRSVGERSSEIDPALTARFLSDAPASELGNIAVGLVVVTLLIGLYPALPLALWFAALLAAVGIRHVVRRRLASRTPAPGRISGGVYLAIVACGLIWAAGAFLLVEGRVEMTELVMIVECGLVAAATATFVSSVLAFQLFAASIFLPLMGAKLPDGLSRDELTTILLVLVFWAVMSVLQKRGNAALVHSLGLQRALERSNQEAVEQEAVIRESEQRMFQLVQSMPVGVIVVNTQRGIEIVNAAAQEIGGPGLRTNAAPEDLAAIYPVYVPGTDDRYPRDRLPAFRALAGESCIDQYEVAGPAGRRLIEAHGSPIRDQTGKVVYGVAVLSDLAERQRGDARRASLNAVLQLTADSIGSGSARRRSSALE